MHGRTSPLRRRATAAAVKSAIHSYHSMDDNSVPLIGETASGTENNDGQEKEKRKKKECCCQLGFLDITAAVAITSSSIVLNITNASIAKAAAFLTMGLCPYASYQRRKLQKLPTLRKVHNELRKETNHLLYENRKLQRSITRLDDNVTRLEQVEDELVRIAGDKRGSLQRLIKISDAQREINEKIKTNLKAVVAQSMLSVVIRSDADNDFLLSPKEIEVLIVRIGMIDGIQFNEKRFRRRMAADQDSSLSTIMAILRSLFSEENPDGDEIFRLCPDQISA